MLASCLALAEGGGVDSCTYIILLFEDLEPAGLLVLALWLLVSGLN